MTDRRTREAVRYLGYGRNAVDEKTLAFIGESFEELDNCARKKSIYRIFECICREKNEIQIGNLKIESRHLSKNLRGCTEVAVFAATLGVEVDFVLRRLSFTDMAKMVVFQACAAAYLEEYCDECQKELEEKMRKEDKYLRPRYSPGYGDVSITYQEDIIQILDTAKHIGLTRTESNMLIPTKSVTAFIGISREKTECHRSGCEVCEKTDCVYRRC